MKIAVHLHVYYHDMLDELLGYVENLNDHNYLLYVTCSTSASEEEKNNFATKLSYLKTMPK